MKQSTFNFDAPRTAGEMAANSCLAAAERRGWDAEGARQFVVRFLGRGQASGEEIVNAAKAAGFVPHDDRAFGAVFGSLSKARVIECVGLGFRWKGHGTAGARIWALRGTSDE